MILSQLWSIMFSFLPAWLSVSLLAVISILVILLVLKIIKIVLDAIPFV